MYSMFPGSYYYWASLNMGPLMIFVWQVENLRYANFGE